MKNFLLLIVLSFTINTFSQEHFGGISTSRRVGITNISNNPSELANLSSKFEVQLMTSSFNLSNNKIGFKDIISGADLKDSAFKGNDKLNLNIDAEVGGPAVAVRLLGFGFAITTKANVKLNLVNVDSFMGDILANGGQFSVAGNTTVRNPDNQKMSGVLWGEVGLSAAKRLYKTENHQINAGVTLKLLFPGAYGNIGLNNFNGSVTTNSNGTISLANATGNVNIAYSGGLATSFTDFNDYTQSIYGPLNGMSGDIGMDYQYKPDGKNFKLKIGAAIKNIGSLTFKADNNYSKDYSINSSQTLNVNQFQNLESITSIEAALGNFIIIKETQKDFKLKLPTVINFYTDLKIIPKLSVTAFVTQRVGNNADNNQIVALNSVTITPRFNLSIFEAFLPITQNEISGINAGIGLRLGGFFIGSNGAITALTSNAKQADFYTGFRFGFL